jgi:anhydro-N-acetylmuramic acid kinase
MTTRAVGLMSGTSLDGVDAALVQIAGEREVTLEAFVTRPFASSERTAIRQVLQEGRPRQLALLHRQLGEWFAQAVADVLAAAGVGADRVSLVASHGLTVWHEPPLVSLQLGCPATIAERSGVQVVSDFRARDVAVGGQGAPLVPMADVMLFGHDAHGRVLLNIGGMANVTWVPRRGNLEGVVAFDTGPGVAVMDAVARMVDPSAPYDVGGTRAGRGRAVASVVQELLERPYFATPPPKSTGREVFGEPFARALVARARMVAPGVSDDDLVATALAFTVRSIAGQVNRWIPAEPEGDLVVSGGGARNPTLVAQVRRALDRWVVRSFDDEFFDGDAKEAVAFAYLGWRSLRGLSGNVPAATGGTRARVLGSVTPALRADRDGTS